MRNHQIKEIHNKKKNEIALKLITIKTPRTQEWKKKTNLLALLGSIRASSASLSGAIAFFTPSIIIAESASNDVVEDPSMELLCRWCPILRSPPPFPPPPLSSPPPNPIPSKKSEPTDRLLRCPPAIAPAGLGLPPDSSESTAIGTAPEAPGEGRGSGEGSVEMSRSEASKRSRSSKFAAKRNDVSEWERRWWDPRSGMRSRSTVAGGFPTNFGSIEVRIKIQSFFLFFLFFLGLLFVLVVVGSGDGEERERRRGLFRWLLGCGCVWVCWGTSGSRQEIDFSEQKLRKLC